MSLISVKNLSFAYEAHQVLEDVSFEVQEGDYLGIIGPNGSGKTTLLRLLLGLLKPQQGEITLFGQSPDQLNNRSTIGYVPQRIASADFNFPATVYEVVKSGRTAKTGLLSFFSQEDEKTVTKAMELTGVTKNKDRLVSKLSGGERQRVFIARALASEPKLLILDEPTVGVDIASQETFYTLLCELNKHHELTIILVSHDIDVVAQEVKNVLFLNRKVVAYGPAKEIMHEGALEKLYGSQVKFIQHRH